MGEKTATKWIAEYGSLQSLVDNVDQVKGKVGDALRANLASVVLNRELTELVKDVPLAQTPDTLRMQPWDRDHIHRLFDDLEFRVLRDRLFDTLASADPECLLAEQPGQGLRMTRIAELLGRPKTRLTYQIACLQHAGLVTRQSVCGDKRGVEVALTDKARRLLREASGALAETVTAALDHVMGPEQCAALSGLLPDAEARTEAHAPTGAEAHAGASAGSGARAGADPEPAASD